VTIEVEGLTRWCLAIRMFGEKYGTHHQDWGGKGKQLGGPKNQGHGRKNVC